MFEKIRLWYVKMAMMFWSLSYTAFRKARVFNDKQEFLRQHLHYYSGKKWSKWSKRYSNLVFKEELWYTPFKEES